jgi:hypothetical protein
MITLREHPQGSLEWLQYRCGIPTASEFDNLVSPTGEIRKGQMPKTYLCTKLAEWWTNTPVGDALTFDMDQGKILEEEARPFFTLETGLPVDVVSFCTTDDGRVGCSPDGLVGDESGVEIKCPRPDTHCRYLFDGVLPSQYVAQVQGSMFVTGRQQWWFVSYNRRFPALLLTIERDEEYHAKLSQALQRFLAEMDAGKQRLMQLNGGPPRWMREPELPRQPQPVPVDLIP